MKTSTALSFLHLHRYRGLSHLIIAMTLFALGTGVMLMQFVKSRVVAAAGEELTLAATEIAEITDRLLFERQGDVLMMARAFPLRVSDPRYLSEYLRWVKASYAPAYQWLAVTNGQGTIVAATEPSLTGHDYSNTPWFRAARATRRLGVADVAVHEAEKGVATLAFTAPILDSQGTFLGVVTTRVPRSFLEEVAARTIRAIEGRQGRSGRVEYQLLTRQGDVFVDSSGSLEGGVNPKDMRLLSMLLNAAGVPGFIEEEHVRRHVQVVTGYAQTRGFGEFTGLGWSVLVRMDRQDILASLHTYLWKVGVIGGVVWTPMLVLLFWSTARLRAEHRQAQQESVWAKAAETALLQSQERNRAIVDTALDGVIIIDSAGVVSDWNVQATAIFGWSREEVLGKALSETIIPERDRQAHKQGLQDFLLTGTGAILNRRIETIVQHRDGRELPVELAVSPVQVGNTYIFSAFIRDITERRRAERRLASQYAVTRVLAESATLEEAVPKIIQAIGESLEWELCVFWRVDKAADVLRCLDQWLRPSLQAEPFMQATWQLVLTRGEGLSGRIWASGKPAWVTDIALASTSLQREAAREVGFHGAFGFPVQVGGEIEGVIELYSRQVQQPDDELLKMVEDIGLKVGQFGERAGTERALRETEAQLRQAQKMEAVGRLAGGVAHDFNNLLTVIRGYSELLLMRLMPADSMRNEMEEIKKAADRASELTRQLMAFSRRQFVVAKVLDLNSLISNMEGMLRRLLGEDIVEFCAELDSSAGAIKADPGQIEQVVMNLVVNARDAMPKGGCLTIQTQNVTIEKGARRDAVGVESGSYVLLAVRDTGHGMDAEIQSHLFEPFFTTKRQGKGTGLGLSTVYGIVKRSGGTITVESAPGLGTTFRIYFPRVEQEAQGAAVVDVVTPESGRETVLLVEDEPSLRRLVHETLRLQGYTVLEARHGIEALLTAAKYGGPIHLLLTDVVMPQMNGPEVAAELLIVRPGIKVLYMSGYPDHPVFDQGDMNRETSFLAKPFSPNVLAKKVREILDDVPAS